MGFVFFCLPYADIRLSNVAELGPWGLVLLLFLWFCTPSPHSLPNEVADK